MINYRGNRLQSYPRPPRDKRGTCTQLSQPVPGVFLGHASACNPVVIESHKCTLPKSNSRGVISPQYTPTVNRRLEWPSAENLTTTVVPFVPLSESMSADGGNN